MSTHAKFLADIEAFIARHRIGSTQFSIDAAGDRAFLTRLRDGRDVKTKMLDRVRNYMDQYERKKRPRLRVQARSLAA